ncbi:MAG: restriction endonuclease subunit S [Corynebacterium pyruviciproducens]|uniref:Restriction endonuclease subunit S n=1 Tax=Corynebacterium pyruviciproducens TaxID=598660 RepID=A0AAF0YUP9_9CORY|nr:restriction endonuclease subunit S [Corynebacterium pyruviciproducens]WOT02244.1 restriction endonuclease subunit S [Corynebacterium pyruviciproducens]
MGDFSRVPLGLVAQVVQSNVDKKSKEGETPVRLLNYTDVYYNESIDMSLDFMEATASAEQITRLSLSVGDVVITKDSETADDIGIPVLIKETADDFVCAYHLSIIRPDKSRIRGDYLFWCLKSKKAAEYWESRVNGVTRFSLPTIIISSLEIPLPLIETQQRIADYLDKETSEIDTLVRELDEYIEFLEKRNNKFLIDGTKIFDQDIPTTRLGWHARIELGKTIQGEQQSPADVLQKYVRAGNIQPDGRFEGEEKTMWFTPKESEIYSLKKGDVLIVEGGAGFGRSLTLEKDLVNWGFQNHIIRVRPDNGWDSKFIDYVIRAYKAAGYIDLLAVGATIPGFSSEKAKKLKVPFLTLEEQEEIVQDISRELSETNRIVEECTELKEILLKRRQVLITDVVTGKVEV